MAARTTRLDYTQLTARERRRLAGTMLLRAAVVSTVAVVGYFWLPMQDWTDLALGAQLAADRVDIGILVALRLGRECVRAEESRRYRYGAMVFEKARGAELARLGRRIEPITGFDLDGGYALGDQRIQAR